MRMLPDHTIRSAKGAHTHIARERFPGLHHCVHLEGIVRVGPIEAEGLEVVEDQIALRGLVEHELNDLRAVLAGPPLSDLFETLDRHAAFFLLDVKILIGCGTDHKLHFGIELCLQRRTDGDVEFGLGRRFGGRFVLVEGRWYELRYLRHIFGLSS